MAAKLFEPAIERRANLASLIQLSTVPVLRLSARPGERLDGRSGQRVGVGFRVVARGGHRLQRGRSNPRAFFELRLMFQAVRRPWHRLETLLANRSAVDLAGPVGASLDPSERRAHLREDRRIRLGEGEVLILQLLDVGEVAGFGLVLARVAGGADLVSKTRLA